jgi:hypothetical protein
VGNRILVTKVWKRSHVEDEAINGKNNVKMGLGK